MAGKHIKGHLKGTRRHILVDTNGFLLSAVVHSAGDQDYAAAKWVFEKFATFGRNERFKLAWADGIYDKARVRQAAAEFNIEVEIIKRSDDVKGASIDPTGPGTVQASKSSNAAMMSKASKFYPVGG